MRNAIITLSDRIRDRLKTPGRFIGLRRLFSSMVMGCAIVVALGAYDYVNMKRAIPEARMLMDEIEGLRSEIDDRERQVVKFQTKIDELQLKLIRLHQLDQRIRTGAYSGLYMDNSVISWPNAGMGGAFLNSPSRIDMSADDYQCLIDNLAERMEQLDEAMVKRSEDFLLLWGAIKEIKQIQESTPSIRPVDGGKMTSGFGYRRSPFTGNREFHSGVDISLPSGAPVYATAAGRVLQSGYQGVLGKTVTIDHGFGIITRYAHLSSADVKVDQQIQQGEVVGKIGSTGRSTGPHLHYEVRVNDIPVDASKFMPEFIAKK